MSEFRSVLEVVVLVDGVEKEGSRGREEGVKEGKEEDNIYTRRQRLFGDRGIDTPSHMFN
jgi:hypothetical protein